MAEEVLSALRDVAPGAAPIGDVKNGSGQVVLDTAFGGQRMIDELVDVLLPRIC